MKFTLNNHLEFSVGGRKFGYRETPFDKYVVSVGKIDLDYYKTSDWVQEQYRTAECVRRDLGEFVVMFSGGTDSEIVLRTFKKMNIKHRTVFIKLSDDNLIDLAWARKVADDIGIELEIVEIDVVDFFRGGEAYEIATEVQCNGIAYLPVYSYLLKLGMPAVMGGEMLLARDTREEPTKWYLGFDEGFDASVYRFSMKHSIPMVVDWFSYTPEMMGYWLQHPEIVSLIGNRFNYKLNSVSSKNRILKTLVPDILERTKRTGYEQLPGFRYETTHELRKRMPIKYDPSIEGAYLTDIYLQLFGSI